MKKTEEKTNSSVKEKGKKSLFKCEGLKNWYRENKVMSIGIVVILACFLAGYFLKGMILAATVNGKPIWRASVIRQLENYQGAAFLDSIITEELIRQEAKTKGLVVTKEEMDMKIKELEESFTSSGTTLNEALEAQGMTMKDVEKNIELTLLVEKALATVSPVTDEEVQKYIDDNKDSFTEEDNMDDIKALVKQQLQQQKMSQEYESWLQQLKDNAKINIVTKY